MATKRRKVRRVRLSPMAELEAWSMMFRAGFDYFGTAAALTGLQEPVNVWAAEDRAEAEGKWLAAAQDAWRRLGRFYLDNWYPHSPQEPWALVQFGHPHAH